MEGHEILNKGLHFARMIEQNLLNAETNQFADIYNNIGVGTRLMYPNGVDCDTEELINNDKEKGPVVLPTLLILIKRPQMTIDIYRNIQYCLEQIINYIDENISDKITDYINNIVLSFDISRSLDYTTDEEVIDFDECYEKYQEFMICGAVGVFKKKDGTLVEFVGFGYNDSYEEYQVIYKDIDPVMLYHSTSIEDFFTDRFIEIY